jgi:NADPH2:quinone reductase
MRAVLCERFEGIGALRLGETPEPAPAEDEVLIDVHAASVSYMDYLMICGRYQLRPALPYVPGTDAAGVIVAVGDKVERFRCGDRVACANWFGGFAERMVAKASKSARIPDNVDFAVGSTVLHAYLTAWYALVDRARLKPGETVLITGAAGGVGLACVEVASLLGGRVIAAVGSASKAEVPRDMGAEHVVDYGSEDIRERVKSLTGGEGVDLAVDNVGGALFLTLARLMRWNGRLIPIGFAGGEIPSLPMNLPLLKNYSVVGVFAGAWTTNFPEEAAEAADRIMAFVGEGRLNPHIDRLLPLEEAAEAMRAVAERSVRGRVVLKVR